MRDDEEMNEQQDWKNRWRGLSAEALKQLEQRSYKVADLGARLSTQGVDAGDLTEDVKNQLPGWIPGVELFSRRVFEQRHRGHFGEFARQGEGKLGEIGFWPKQWAAATMFAGTSKGFHIHPPFIPEGQDANTWFSHLFGNSGKISDRPYDLEQWDVMFFLTGIVEMFLVDERAGMERKRMRFFIDGDDRPGKNNVGVVIPAGVAHALRAASSTDVLMVYGTSTVFNPENEGRIQSGIESAPLHDAWGEYFNG